MSQKLYNEYKKFEFCEKNELKFNLKHRNAQNSFLSGRFGALSGRPGDLMKNLETNGKTGRVGRYGVQGIIPFSPNSVQDQFSPYSYENQ